MIISYWIIKMEIYIFNLNIRYFSFNNKIVFKLNFIIVFTIFLTNVFIEMLTIYNNYLSINVSILQLVRIYCS